MFFLFETLTLGCATADDLPLACNVSLEEDLYEARYKQDCDTVAGKTLCIMTGDALQPFSPRYPLLSPGILKVQDEKGQSAYSLTAVSINMNEWMNIEKGKTLGLSIDNEDIELSGDDSSDQRIQCESGKVYEVA